MVFGRACHDSRHAVSREPYAIRQKKPVVELEALSRVLEGDEFRLHRVLRASHQVAGDDLVRLDYARLLRSRSWTRS